MPIDPILSLVVSLLILRATLALSRVDGRADGARAGASVVRGVGQALAKLRASPASTICTSGDEQRIACAARRT
jgi:hypothetical protein